MVLKISRLTSSSLKKIERSTKVEEPWQAMISIWLIIWPYFLQLKLLCIGFVWYNKKFLMFSFSKFLCMRKPKQKTLNEFDPFFVCFFPLSKPVNHKHFTLSFTNELFHNNFFFLLISSLSRFTSSFFCKNIWFEFMAKSVNEPQQKLRAQGERERKRSEREGECEREMNWTIQMGTHFHLKFIWESEKKNVNYVTSVRRLVLARL